ncbi:MAG: hypothetical protein ACLTFB_01585 [Candidatus Phytoplasma pyri]|uniref:hypothetical protein n=1 Tax=Candidatus Phytoplasma pyri TaxID=47566 RepID=UPI003982EB82
MNNGSSPQFSPIKKFSKYDIPLYKQKIFRILCSIFILTIILIGVIVSIDKSKKQYSIKDLNPFENNINKNLAKEDPFEETRINLESILIFMFLGALILGLKKGTLGITLGYFIGVTIGILIGIFFPIFIYFLEFLICKIFYLK